MEITVLDPSIDVIEHISNNLRGYPTVNCQKISDLDKMSLPKLNRVLVTGQIEKLPEWLNEGLEEGGFAIAPIGDKNSQRLLKLRNRVKNYSKQT